MRVFLNKIIIALFGVSGLIFAQAKTETANEQNSETKLVLKAISQKYTSLGSWQAKITEERVSSGLGGLTKFSEGKIFFARPDRFRFEITTKPASIAASNGREFWFAKLPEGPQKPAQVKHFKSLKDLDLDKYLSFLRGINVQDPNAEAELFKNFKVEAKYQKTHLQLKLYPKVAKEVHSIEMHFMQTENYPSKVIIEDVIGTINTIRVVEASPLEKTKAELFEPTFVKGSEIEKL